jgi:uncharacterized protein with GYD domain
MVNARAKKEDDMAKYLIKATYNPEGARGLLKEGGSARRDTVKKIVEGFGGKLEAFYYAYGDVDAYVIVDAPTATDGLALGLAVNASGAVRLTTTPLITPEEIDAAAKKHCVSSAGSVWLRLRFEGPSRCCKPAA